MSNIGVLCAIDVTDYDQDIVDLAAEFAKQFQQDLDLIHVTLSPDPKRARWPAFVGVPNELERDNRLLREINTRVKGVAIRRHHLFGIPSRTIIDFVHRQKPELLVLGIHPKSGIEMVLGSVASRIMRNVDCPVMIVRQTKNSQALSAT